MNKENFQWLLLALLVIGLAGAGAVIIRQDSRLVQISNSVAMIESQLRDLSNKQANTPPKAGQVALETVPAWKSALAKLSACGTAANVPDAATLEALGLKELLGQGFSAAAVCRDDASGRAGFILAKQELTKPAADVEPTCVDACDKDVFGTIDALSGTMSSTLSVNKLGVYGEAYDQYCMIDRILAASAQKDDAVLLYCGSGESGGLTHWYRYDFSGNKLTTVQVLRSQTGIFDVKAPSLLGAFRHTSNADLNK